MRRLIVIMLFATAVAFGQQAGNTPDAAPKSQAKVLTRTEFDALVAKPDRLLLIDVRRPDEVAGNGGFPVYLSIQIGELEKSLAWIPKDRTIVTVSNHAARAGAAADILTKHGFHVAGAIGAQTYEQAGGKLTKIVPPAPRTNAPNAGNNGGDAKLDGAGSVR
jgi:rhodanese-related sulfurtransferase